jgi:D-tyrosyl-tRNA(Tyr) deacylase
VVQRVSAASVTVAERETGAIGRGLLILLGVTTGDTEAEARFIADKCVNLRIFADEEGKMNRSVLDIGGEILVVSQFTLYGDCRRGRRPSFVAAAPPAVSEPLYEYFVKQIAAAGLKTATGVFGASMRVRLENEGPVTLIVEKDRKEQ